MKVTEFTRRVLRNRHFIKKMRDAGYRESEPYWEITRGVYTNSRIVDVVISPDGKYLWSKVDPPIPPRESNSY